MITFENVSKVYQQNQRALLVLDSINLQIAQGDIFGLIGASGAGKSSLLRLINRLEPPSTGKILIQHQDITNSSHQQILKIRRSISMVFQHFHLLWSRTVRGNISLSLEIAGLAKKRRQQRIDELLELVDLTDKADTYPYQLSGGQKQRVGIARAIANHPTILLCDEATSALDPHSTQNILQLLLKINQQLAMTLVLVTHEMKVIQQICHQVAVLHAGKIVEQGPVVQLINRPQHAITRYFLQSHHAITPYDHQVSHSLAVQVSQ